MKQPHFFVQDSNCNVATMDAPTAVAEVEPQHRYETKSKWQAILCVDDDCDLIRTLQIILSNYEVNVLTEYDGRSGIWATASGKPDLIIADWRMPQGGGEALLTSVKHNPELQHIPFIILSAQRNKDIERKAFQAGAELFLHKPIRQTDLVREIKKFVELRKKDCWNKEVQD